MSSVTVRISNEIAEMISERTSNEITHREYIEDLIRATIATTETKPSKPEIEAEIPVDLSGEYSGMKDEFERLSALIRLLAQHQFEGNDHLENALKILSAKHGICAQCNRQMECPNCGCSSPDLIQKSS